MTRVIQKKVVDLAGPTLTKSHFGTAVNTITTIGEFTSFVVIISVTFLPISPWQKQSTSGLYEHVLFSDRERQISYDITYMWTLKK